MQADRSDLDLIIHFIAAIPVVYLFANGLFALMAPNRWLSSTWTATRAMTNRDSSHKLRAVDIRTFGFVLLLAGGVFSYFLLKGLFRRL